MKKWMKWAIAAVILTIIILLYPRIAPFADVEKLRSVVEPFGTLASVIFFLIYVIAGLLFLPMSAFSVAAGIIFGTLWGLILVLLAATVTATIAFIIARQFTNLVPQAKGGVIKKLQRYVEKQLHENTFQAVFIMRLLYMPYIPLSFACGLVKTCKFWPYVIATFCTNIVGSFVFVYLGDQLGKGLTALIIPAILVVLSMLIPYAVKKIIKKR